MERVRTRARTAAAGVGIALIATTLAACGSDKASSAAAAPSGPIKVGNISAVTGPIPLGFAADGAKAFFDSLNANGGINGRKVELTVKDDKSDPALSAQAARTLAQDKDIVGLVGDLTLVGCGANRQVLERNNLRSLMVASDPACFTQPNVAPINAGQNTDWRIAMVWAAHDLGKKALCPFFTQVGTLKAGNEANVAYFEKTTGQKVAYADYTLTQESNLPALMATAKQKGCDAVLTDGTPNQVAPLVAARNQQKLDVPIIVMGALYDASAAKALGNPKDVYSIAEVAPFTGDDPIVQRMKADLKKAGVAVGALPQFGWTAAFYFSEIAKTIKGPITRDSYGKALLALDSLDTQGSAATPFSFGSGKAHNANRGGKIVKAENGGWKIVTPDWIVLKDG